MDEVIVTGIIGLLSTITSSWASWTFAKRKYYSEVDHNLIENMENSLEFYKKLSDDNRARLEEMAERNKALETELKDLKNQVLNLTMNICMDLTCKRRLGENQYNEKKNGKVEDRYDEK